MKEAKKQGSGAQTPAFSPPLWSPELWGTGVVPQRDSEAEPGMGSAGSPTEAENVTINLQQIVSDFFAINVNFSN